jgi:hypothetical protein
MVFAELWLPIIGAGIFIAWAIGAWYGESKVLAIWLIFAGVVCLLLLGTLQWQHALEKSGTNSDEISPTEIAKSRAYVTVISSDLYFMPDGRAEARLVFKNTGNTVANNLTTRVGIVASEFPRQEGFIDPWTAIPDKMNTEPLGVGDTGTIVIATNRSINLAERDEMAQGTMAIFAWGEIRYVDIYGVTRSNKFRRIYGGNSRIVGNTMFVVPIDEEEHHGN